MAKKNHVPSPTSTPSPTPSPIPTPSPTKGGTGGPDEETARKLDHLRVMIAKVVGQYFLPLLIITILFAILLVVIIATKLVSADTTEKMALAASVQVGFGMVIGYVCVYIGLMMTWFGIEASYEVDVKGEAAIGGLSLKSASPGLLFALGGMILIAVCLYKPIVYEAKTPFRKYPTNPPDQGSSQSKNDASNEEGKTSDPEITPNPPPGYKTTE